MVAMSEKPKPLKVFGRSHYACNRCKSSKIKCSGERPACSNCKLVGKGDMCMYPAKDRKIVIMESDLNALHARVQHLENVLKAQGSTTDTADTPKLESMVQPRSDYSREFADSFLLPDTSNESVPHKLLVLCAHQLPEKSYTFSLFSQICLTYSTEFYIVDQQELSPLIQEVYDFFMSANLFQKTSYEHLPRISPLTLGFFFAMLAFGEQMQNSTEETMSLSAAASLKATEKIPGTDFYATASRLFSISYEQTNVRFIQTALLLGLFACNLNRYNTVYNYFGVALRSAIANGYHRHLKKPSNLTEEESQGFKVFEEKTKRLWWTIFVVDVFWAARMNIPVHIEYTDTDVNLPNESPIELHDNFDIESLECNVHLMKYTSKFIRLIYGPNIRTYSVNYINSDKINQRLLVKNILACVNDVVLHFEETTLASHKDKNLLEKSDRNLANLFSRYNHLTIMCIHPLIHLLFNSSSAANIEDRDAVVKAISKGFAAAERTLLIIFKHYEYKRLFVLGFWDSEHLFAAIIILLMASIAGYRFEDYNKAIALLRYMACQNNINARNSMQKLSTLDDVLSRMPQLNIRLNLNGEISHYIAQRGNAGLSLSSGEFFNPFVELQKKELDFTKSLEGRDQSTSLYDQLGFGAFNEQTRFNLWKLAQTIQGWYRNSSSLLHVSGGTQIPVKTENSGQVFVP